jgi:aspartate racemase
MATAGHITEAQRGVFLSIGRYLCQARGAEAIVLGGTDLVRAFAGQDCDFPVVDCALVHIEALFRRTIASE